MRSWKQVGNGTLGKSKKDGTGAPYYGNGTITFDGIEHKFSIGAWVKTNKEGGQFYSLRFSVEENDDAAPSYKVGPDEDIPF